jgi:hypothetical protein
MAKHSGIEGWEEAKEDRGPCFVIDVIRLKNWIFEVIVATLGHCACVMR